MTQDFGWMETFCLNDGALSRNHSSAFHFCHCPREMERKGKEKKGNFCSVLDLRKDLQ